MVAILKVNIVKSPNCKRSSVCLPSLFSKPNCKKSVVVVCPLFISPCFSFPPPGSYCASNGLALPTGLCSAGYYCPEGQSQDSPVAYQCTPGHYCPEGSPTELACESGSYQDEFAQV